MAASEASQQANRAEMDPRRLVVIAFLLFGVVGGLFLGNMVAMLFAQLNVRDAELLEGTGIPRSMVVGFVLSIAGLAYVWTNAKTHDFSLNVATELMRVTWPTWEETRVSTVAVVVASIIAALLLFGMDTLSYKLMVDWLPVVWGKL